MSRDAEAENRQAARADMEAARARGIDGRTLVVFVVATRDIIEQSRQERREALREAVSAWKSACETVGNNMITVAVHGYDDDPRELWEIPEVIEFVGRWEQGARASTESRLADHARTLLQLIQARYRPN